jgi:hypothetical protein
VEEVLVGVVETKEDPLTPWVFQLLPRGYCRISDY